VLCSIEGDHLSVALLENLQCAGALISIFRFWPI
jgi:hypothetical protein